MNLLNLGSGVQISKLAIGVNCGSATEWPANFEFWGGFLNFQFGLLFYLFFRHGLGRQFFIFQRPTPILKRPTCLIQNDVRYVDHFLFVLETGSSDRPYRQQVTAQRIHKEPRMLEQMWDLLSKTAVHPLAGIFLPFVAAYLTWRWLHEYRSPWGSTLGETLKRDLELLELANAQGLDVSQYREFCRRRVHEHFDTWHRRGAHSALVIGPIIVGPLTLAGVGAYYANAGHNLLFSLGVDVALILLTYGLHKLTKISVLEPEEAPIPVTPEVPK